MGMLEELRIRIENDIRAQRGSCTGLVVVDVVSLKSTTISNFPYTFTYFDSREKAVEGLRKYYTYSGDAPQCRGMANQEDHPEFIAHRWLAMLEENEDGLIEMDVMELLVEESEKGVIYHAQDVCPTHTPGMKFH